MKIWFDGFDWNWRVSHKILGSMCHAGPFHIHNHTLLTRELVFIGCFWRDCKILSSNLANFGKS